MLILQRVQTHFHPFHAKTKKKKRIMGHMRKVCAFECHVKVKMCASSFLSWVGYSHQKIF